jgi:hypothetical protein
MKLSVGQTIFLKPIGNAARRSTDLIETKIAKIGKKYFEVENGYYGRFFIDTLTQDGGQYISNYQGYLSKEELETERETKRLYDKIREEYFNSYSSGAFNIGLGKLKKIEDILNS